MASKSEKRNALKALKKQKFEEKRAVAVQNILAVKQTAEAATPAASKIPVEYKTGESRMPHMMLYGTSREDRVGAWGWGQKREWHPDPGNEYIYGFLNGYKSKTWSAIEAELTKRKGDRQSPRNKGYAIHKICAEAQKRLGELKLDDHENIFRFRMAGKKRLYGFIFGITFETVWYDAEHLIYQGDN